METEKIHHDLESWRPYSYRHFGSNGALISVPSVTYSSYWYTIPVLTLCWNTLAFQFHVLCNLCLMVSSFFMTYLCITLDVFLEKLVICSSRDIEKQIKHGSLHQQLLPTKVLTFVMYVHLINMKCHPLCCCEEP